MNQRGIWQLILMAREGDRQAIDELFYSSFRPAYLILYAITADKSSSLDILAEGYVEVFQKLDTLENGSDFSETLNRFVIGRAKALFPSEEFLCLPDGCEADAFGFRQNPPQIHDFDTLPAIKLSARADEILSAFRALPLAQQLCAYLYYYVQLQPDVIADILSTHENKVCGSLQQARQAVLPMIDAVLKKSTAFRGTDAESAIPWALRCTEQYAPTSDETDACYQKVIGKLVSSEILEAAAQEESEPELDFQMKEIAPPKEHHVLHAIFSLRTLICVLVVLIVVGCIVGVRQWHNYKERRNSLENQTDRTTLTMTQATIPSERNIFYTEYALPTEPQTEEPVATTEAPTETTTEEVTEAPTVTEPTSPVITTTSPYADFNYSITGNTVTINKYSGNATSLKLDKIEGKSVSAIGNNAFKGCTSLVSVDLPSTLRSIGDSAFESCSGLTGIEIPASVTKIGNNAFKGCGSLNRCDIEDKSKLDTLGSGLFVRCYALTSFEIPSAVTEIPADCFRQTSISTISIPDNVKKIGEKAFQSCGKLQTINFGKNSKLQSIGPYAFNGCTALGSVTIPASVTKIDESAFEKCPSLKTVTIQKGTTTIGKSAFSGCTNLQKITIPDTVKTIGDDAFKGCEHLVIACPAGSAAEKYAEKHQIPIEGRTDTTNTSESSSA